MNRPLSPAAIRELTEPEAYTPTAEDLAELNAYLERLAEVLDECPCCGELVRVGDDSERLGSRYLCRPCCNWLEAQEADCGPADTDVK